MNSDWPLENDRGLERRSLTNAPALIRFHLQLFLMSPTIEVSEELVEQIDAHLAEGESRAEFLEEIIHHFEAEGTTLWEGYGGPP